MVRLNVDNRVDVVIPVYNGVRYLEAAVRSAVGQTHPPARIIIADDGSTDGSPAVAARLKKEFPCVELLRLEHAGVSAARNAGIRRSDAPFVAFLDADDVWHPRKLEAQMAIFARSGPSLAFVYTAYEHIDEKGRPMPDAYVFSPTRRGDIFRPLLFREYVVSGSASSVVVSREMLDRAGYFDEALYFGEDWDLWIRLAAIGHVDAVAEVLVSIRVHGESAQRQGATKKTGDSFVQHLRIYAKWPNETATHRDFRSFLRRKAVNMMLPAVLEPHEIGKFYKKVRDSGALGLDLFRSRIDLWSQLILAVCRYLVWKLGSQEKPFGA